MPLAVVGEPVIDLLEAQACRLGKRLLLALRRVRVLDVLVEPLLQEPLRVVGQRKPAVARVRAQENRAAVLPLQLVDFAEKLYALAVGVLASGALNNWLTLVDDLQSPQSERDTRLRL